MKLSFLLKYKQPKLFPRKHLLIVCHIYASSISSPFDRQMGKLRYADRWIPSYHKTHWLQSWGCVQAGAARPPAPPWWIPVSQDTDWESPKLEMPMCHYGKPQMGMAVLYTFPMILWFLERVYNSLGPLWIWRLNIENEYPGLTKCM